MKTKGISHRRKWLLAGGIFLLVPAILAGFASTATIRIKMPGPSMVLNQIAEAMGAFLAQRNPA